MRSPIALLRPSMMLIFTGACVTYASPAGQSTHTVPVPVASPVQDRPERSDRTELWLSQREFRRGDMGTVFFRTSEDAFVTILRVGTDGDLEVLYPEYPSSDNFVRAGRTHSVRDDFRPYSFRALEPPGTGFVFAITSGEPFDYRDVTRHSRWSPGLHRLARNDPFAAVEEFAERTVPWRAWYSLEYAEYRVDAHRASNVVYVYRDYHVWWPYRRVRCYDYDRYSLYDYYDCDYYYYDGGRARVRRQRLEAKEDFTRARLPGDDAIGRRRRPVVTSSDQPPAPRDSTIVRRRPPVADDGGGAGDDDQSTDRGKEKPGNRGRRRGHEADGPGNSNEAPGHGGERGNSGDAPGHARPHADAPASERWERGRPTAPRRTVSESAEPRSEERAARNEERPAAGHEEAPARRDPQRAAPSESQAAPRSEPRGDGREEARPRDENRAAPARRSEPAPAAERSSSKPAERSSSKPAERRSEPAAARTESSSRGESRARTPRRTPEG